MFVFLALAVVPLTSKEICRSLQNRNSLSWKSQYLKSEFYNSTIMFDNNKFMLHLSRDSGHRLTEGTTTAAIATQSLASISQRCNWQGSSSYVICCITGLSHPACSSVTHMYCTSADADYPSMRGIEPEILLWRPEVLVGYFENSTLPKVSFCALRAAGLSAIGACICLTTK